MRRIAIIGGGITGLTAAFTLEQQTDHEITLFDASETLGGKLQTSAMGDFTVEAGPDSIFLGKPGSIEIIRQLGLEDEMIEPQAGGYSLLADGNLHPVPHGIASFGNISMESIAKADFLSGEGKRLALAEPNVPAGDGADESIRSFFSRRFGPEFSERVAEPIMAGTHAGDPSLLSMRALYPHYLDMEVKNGNLTARPPSATPSGAPKGPMFVSFKTGMRRLTDALGEALTRTDMRLGDPVQSIKPAGSKLDVAAQSGESRFDHVLVTIPANYAKGLFTFSPGAAASLGEIPFASSVIVSVGLREGALEKKLCGTGFLTTFSPQGLLTGCTWTSNKWSHRAPQGSLLIRFFFGGAGKPDLTTKSDAELTAMALEAAKELLGLREAPVHIQVSRWQAALPQYNMGHRDRVGEIESALDSFGITLAGSSYRGAGIPDCMRQGAEAAKKIQEVLT